MKRLRLASADRAFFRLVREAAIANPFSDERRRLDLEIAGAQDRQDDEWRVEAAARQVTEHVEQLVRAGRLKSMAWAALYSSMARMRPRLSITL